MHKKSHYIRLNECALCHGNTASFTDVDRARQHDSTLLAPAEHKNIGFYGFCAHNEFSGEGDYANESSEGEYNTVFSGIPVYGDEYFATHADGGGDRHPFFGTSVA